MSSVVKGVTVACKYELLAKHAISVCVCVRLRIVCMNNSGTAARVCNIPAEGGRGRGMEALRWFV